VVVLVRAQHDMPSRCVWKSTFCRNMQPGRSVRSEWRWAGGQRGARAVIGDLREKHPAGQRFSSPGWKWKQGRNCRSVSLSGLLFLCVWMQLNAVLQSQC